MSRRDDWQTWREDREAVLAEEHGWLSLTRFAWLPDRPEHVDGLPGRWWATPDGAHLEASQADELLDGESGTVVDGVVTADVAEGASLTWLRHGTRAVELLRRGGRLAVRVRDPQAPTRVRFAGVPTFEHDERWVRPARFTPAEPVLVQVGTAREDLVQQARVVGTVAVEVGGATHELAAVAAGDGLGLLFHDETNSSVTSPWRVVTTGSPDEDGSVEVDFNRAVNLPFAFSAYGTCPAPVAGNSLPLPVTAGEKRPA